MITRSGSENAIVISRKKIEHKFWKLGFRVRLPNSIHPSKAMTVPMHQLSRNVDAVFPVPPSPLEILWKLPCWMLLWDVRRERQESPVSDQILRRVSVEKMCGGATVEWRILDPRVKEPDKGWWLGSLVQSQRPDWCNQHPAYAGLAGTRGPSIPRLHKNILDVLDVLGRYFYYRCGGIILWSLKDSVVV